MNIKEIIYKVRIALMPRKDLSKEAVQKILHVLENAREEDASCEEIYLKLDEYVEREIDKKDAALLMPVIREHLDICQECCDEYEALLDVLNRIEQT